MSAGASTVTVTVTATTASTAAAGGIGGSVSGGTGGGGGGGGGDGGNNNEGGTDDGSNPPDLPDEITFEGKHFSNHARDHMPEWGLDVTSGEDRAQFRSIIENIFYNPDEIRQGPFNPNAGGGTDYLYYRQGNSIVVTRSDGRWVSIWRNGTSNPHWVDASIIR